MLFPPLHNPEPFNHQKSAWSGLSFLGIPSALLLDSTACLGSPWSRPGASHVCIRIRIVDTTYAKPKQGRTSILLGLGFFSSALELGLCHQTVAMPCSSRAGGTNDARLPLIRMLNIPPRLESLGAEDFVACG